jgi:hypothetical protein
MKLVFCNNLLEPGKPDEDFEKEYQAARQAGFETYLISLESLREGDLSRTFRRIPEQAQMEPALYRGWMLNDKEYETLYQGLSGKCLQLINSPLEYLNGHYFPNSYPQIQDHTPRSVSFEWSGVLDLDVVMGKLAVFGSRPLIIKDYVKSEKHDWEQACFIPSAADREAIERVTRQFLELRGKYLNKGLVYREYVDLEQLSRHSKSGMPLSNEFRIFYLHHEMLISAPYWEEGEYNGKQPNFEPFHQIASRIESNFFTMDVAKQSSGEWVIMELGDGQVSGLPMQIDTNEFYRRLKKSSDYATFTAAH